MFPIPAGIITGTKWLVILIIISSIGYGVKWTYNKHLDAVNNAVNQAKLEAALSEQTAVRKVTDQLKIEQEAERLAMQIQLDQARATASNLRRTLLIDHDLDRLLQRKPGLVLPSINKGTKEVLRELEELTR